MRRWSADPETAEELGAITLGVIEAFPARLLYMVNRGSPCSGHAFDRQRDRGIRNLRDHLRDDVHGLIYLTSSDLATSMSVAILG